MEPSSPDVRLTEHQHRHVRLTFDGLIRETREWLERWEEVGVTGPEGPKLRRALDELLAEVERAARQLGVPVTERVADPRRRLAAWASTWWSGVLDARPSALRAYGEVDPATARTLAPIVEALAERLLEVTALSRRAEQESSREGPSS